MLARRIRVLIVDDSAVVRKLVSDALGTDPAIEVVGTAIDPYIARDKILQLKPDVITLDLEMPRMDGLTFLKILMEQHPLPVIIMSSLSQRGSEYAMEALRLGAMDVLAKPGGSYSFGDLGPQLIARIKACVGARVRGTAVPVPARPIATSRPVATSRPAAPRTTGGVILLGASTGGTEALREVLTNLPDGLPPIAIVQHIPPVFSRHFAERLNQLCAFEVREAVDGDRLCPGLALVAPGNFHLLLCRQGTQWGVRVVSGPPVWHQRPAVDILFKSAVDCGAARHAIAGVFTGMGKDGAEGLLRLRQNGATTFAQDEASSVVYGMPRAAWENGGAQQQLPLDRAADFIIRQVEAPKVAASSPAISA
jgi:two-component system chemotaxis response regulator CheB